MRAGDADQVDAVVLVEALVLDGDERLPDVLGQRADRDARARLASDLADERAVAREHERRLRLRDDLPRRSGGLRRGVGVWAASGAASGERDEDGERERAFGEVYRERAANRATWITGRGREWWAMRRG